MVKILVVDDDRELQENIVDILTSEGFDVAAAGHGEEALDMLRRSPFDLVLLDMIMPGMGGLEALPQIKRLCPGARSPPSPRWIMRCRPCVRGRTTI